MENTDEMLIKLRKSCEYIRQRSKYRPEIAIILGSGLGDLALEIENPDIIKYDEIPHFPVSTVEGHEGQFVIGELSGKVVMAMQGRFHYYEGYGMNDVVYPIRVMKLLGVSKLLLTNAAGAVNKDYKPGDLMIISDHINLSGTNPLIGRNLDEFGVRFPDLSNAYSSNIINKIKKVAIEQNIDIKEGVYAFLTGPTYETPSEVSMIRLLGADAVGMSTVPEAIVAVHSQMEVAGISCLTNMAAGILDTPLNHKEVIATSQKVKKQFICLIKELIINI